MNDHDPTAIQLSTDGTDPLVARMDGITVHGHLEFDCPVITPIADRLWMGGWDVGLVLPAKVDHIVSLFRWGGYQVMRPPASALVVEMYDRDGDVPTEQVVAMARWVNTCRADGITLVHCQAGLNRSALVVASALVLDGHEPAAAVEALRAKRSPAVLCNPAFERWLLDDVGGLTGGGVG